MTDCYLVSQILINSQKIVFQILFSLKNRLEERDHLNLVTGKTSKLFFDLQQFLRYIEMHKTQYMKYSISKLKSTVYLIILNT